MKKTLLFVCSLLISLSTNAADFESAKDAVKNMGIGWIEMPYDVFNIDS